MNSPSSSSPPTLFRGMNRAQLDTAYNNVTHVGQDKRDAYVADWKQRSAILRQRPHARLDVPYGPAPRERLDIFPSGTVGGPTLVYIHGGYWQWNDKERDAFVGEAALGLGCNVVLVEYTLAPAVQLAGMIAEVRAAVAWIIAHAAGFGGDPSRVVVAGHSAGGHLAAMAMTEPRLAGGLAISGIFDLEPIRLGVLNENLGLDADAAELFSPIRHLPQAAAPLIVSVGLAELPELIRQSDEYAAAWRRRGLPGRYLPVPQRDHFSILEELARPGGVLLQALTELASPRR